MYYIQFAVLPFLIIVTLIGQLYKAIKATWRITKSDIYLHKKAYGK
jgi:hypothetical protein